MDIPYLYDATPYLQLIYFYILLIGMCTLYNRNEIIFMRGRVNFVLIPIIQLFEQSVWRYSILDVIVIRGRDERSENDRLDYIESPGQSLVQTTIDFIIIYKDTQIYIVGLQKVAESWLTPMQGRTILLHLYIYIDFVCPSFRGYYQQLYFLIY